MSIKLNDFTKSDKIKVKILKVLADYLIHTPSEIASVIKTNGTTVLKNCYFLKSLGLVNIEEKKTKRTLYYISLNKKIDDKVFEQSIRDIKTSNYNNQIKGNTNTEY